MITIWKTPIVATVEQVLKDLKLQLYGAGLLKEIKNTGSDLMCTCPFHANGKEHNPSCGVLLGRAGTHIITHDIKSTVNQSLDLSVAQALSTGGSSGAITMDIAVKDEVESPHYEGVGVGMAFTKIITHDINSKATNSGNTTVASPVNTATVITIN